MGKIRQEYQAVRKWYIEQNKKLTVDSPRSVHG